MTKKRPPGGKWTANSRRNDVSLYRCTVCDARWLLWPDAVHGGGWNLLDRLQRPGVCCDNVAMGTQIEHLRDLPLGANAGRR